MTNPEASTSKCRPVNVSLPSDDVAEAKSYGLNVSQITRQALSSALSEERRRRYLEENREAIAAHNAWIEKRGMLLAPMWMQDDVTF